MVRHPKFYRKFQKIKIHIIATYFYFLKLEISDIFLSIKVLFIKYLTFTICSNIEKSTYNHFHTKLIFFHSFSLVSGKNCSSPTGNFSESVTSFSTVLYPLSGIRRRRFSIVERK